MRIDWECIIVMTIFCLTIGFCSYPHDTDKFIKCIDLAKTDQAVKSCDKFFEVKK